LDFWDMLRRRRMQRFFTLILLLLVAWAGYHFGKRAEPVPPFEEPSRIVVQPTPNTIVALRRLAELETAEFAIERVIDIRDKQSHLWGLIRAEDALLLIAGGRVRAGINLAALPEGAIVSDWEQRRVQVRLPAARVLSAHLEEERTYVHTRHTDSLAERKETLESDARRAAEQELEQAAISGGILKMATDNARLTVESLLYSLGFLEVQVTFEAESQKLPK
jgi:hypothetical protein